MPKLKMFKKSIILFLALIFLSLYPEQLSSFYREKHNQSNMLTSDILFKENNLQQDKQWTNLCIKLEKFITGSDNAALITNPKGKILFSKNADKKLIPASTLKILTSLTAMQYLGVDYRFKTEFYMDNNLNLKIKGYGDPFLISEILSEISQALALKIKKYNNLILDDSYFESPITIDGKGKSFNSYDSPNGALCVNFNTVFFRRLSLNNKKGYYYVSAESQTPLLPFALSKIKQSKLKKGRIIISHIEKQNTIYAGHLFQYFFNKQGIQSNDGIRLGKVNNGDKLIFTYVSKFSLKQLIQKLLEHSNNFLANQLLIATGAHILGSPGTVEKGVYVALNYAENMLGIDDICIVEGSGISRKNKISASNMNKIIKQFEPYRSLMRHTGREFFKTGTLKGINTRAGYIENEKQEIYHFAILINSQNKSTKNIMRRLLNEIK